MCPNCKTSCLRPNVMIFGDDQLVYDRLGEQDGRLDAFLKKQQKFMVLEIGAGVVVPSIRYMAETYARVPEGNGGEASGGGGLVRINPSTSECQQLDVAPDLNEKNKYWPMTTTSLEGLKYLADK